MIQNQPQNKILIISRIRISRPRRIFVRKRPSRLLRECRI